MANYPDGTAARIIEVALAEVGTIETGENLTKYGLCEFAVLRQILASLNRADFS